MTMSAIDGASVLPRIRRLLRRSQTPYSILDQGLVSGLGFATGIAAARLVGLEEFGRFAVVMIIGSLAQSVHNALTVAPVMSLAGTRRGHSSSFFASALVATLLVSVPLALGVMGLLSALEIAEGKTIWTGFILATGALAIAQNLLFTVRRLLFAAGRGRDGLATDAVRGLLLASMLGLAWTFGLPVHVDTLVWALAAAAFVPAALAAQPLLKKARPARIRIRALTMRCWPIAKWMLPNVAMTFGQEQAVWLIVGAMLGDVAVGGLRGAQYVVSLAYPFLAALENVAPVQASRAYEQHGITGLRSYIRRLLVMFSPMACGFPLLTALSADFWLKLFFGPTFQGYGTCLRIFALVVLFVFVRDVLSYFFRAVQQTQVTFQAFAVSSVITMIVMVPLIWGGGVVGAAVAIAAGQGVSMLYLLACMTRTWNTAR